MGRREETFREGGGGRWFQYIIRCGQEHRRRTREAITYCEHAKYGLVWGGLLRCQKWEVGMLLGERF